MIVYNVTASVDWNIHEGWLAWMREVYIPMILETKCFFEARMLKLLEIDDSQGPTYAIQFHANTMADYKRFTEIFAGSLQQETASTWGDQFVSFNTVLQVLH